MRRGKRARMNSVPRALTLDLDDTLWPIWPAIERAEAALHDFLREHCPRTAESYPIAGDARAARPHRGADIPSTRTTSRAQRRLSLRARAARLRRRRGACAETPSTPSTPARNSVEFYPDALAALERLAARFPLAALTNGNADLARIGIADHFGCSSRRARSRRRQAAMRRSSTPPAPPRRARRTKCCTSATTRDWTWSAPPRAGLRSCWINRRDERLAAGPAARPTWNSPPSPRWPTGWTRTIPHTETPHEPARLLRHRRRRRRCARRWSCWTARACAAWRDAQPPADPRLARRARLHRQPGSALLACPAATAGRVAVLVGIGDASDPLALAHLPAAAAGGHVSPVAGLADAAWIRPLALLGWGLGAYRFDRYRSRRAPPARLVLDDAGAEDAEAFALLQACVPGARPGQHADRAHGPRRTRSRRARLAQAHGAQVAVHRRRRTAEAEFPGHPRRRPRQSHRAPRLIELRWGDDAHPHVAIVGKGVCFDTGGLDIKPADGMRNMKKDMGGAAHALALAATGDGAQAAGAPAPCWCRRWRTRSAANAFRPGEVIATRQGLTRRDRQHRRRRPRGAVRCADLCRRTEAGPDAGLRHADRRRAHRAGPGPAGAVLPTTRRWRNDYLAAGDATRDPLWRMPLWRPYLRYLEIQHRRPRQCRRVAHGRRDHRGAVPGALRARRRSRGRMWTCMPGTTATAPASPPAARRRAFARPSRCCKARYAGV